MITEIINELNLDNGTNYKIDTLKKYKDNELLKRVLKMAIDRVSFTYGVTMKNISYIPGARITDGKDPLPLNTALDVLENSFCTRLVTGNDALEKLTQLLEELDPDDATLIERILDRDLKCGVGKTMTTKVFKGLIVKPPYERCIIGTIENIKKNFPMDSDGNFKDIIYSNQKLDGTFRRAVKSVDDVEITSRPGIETSFPLIEQELMTLEVDDVVFIGEMTLRGEQNRSTGNGIINSDDIPHDDVIFTVWDLIPLSEFKLSKAEIKVAEKAKTLSLYKVRFEKLEKLIKDAELDHVELVEYRIIKNPKEAYEHFNEIVNRGDEGTVIKSEKLTHKDGDSKLQQKVKLEIEIDVRITGLSEGNKGSKNEDYFAGIEYSNDEGTIKGSVGVTSLTEETRDWFHENRDLVIGNVMSVLCNDITKGRDNDYYAMSHPRYKELRGESKETDTLERALEQKEMAMELKKRIRED